MNPPTPEFDAVVVDLYQAASASHLWPQALSGLAALTGSRGALVTCASPDHAALLNSPGLDDTVSQFFEQGWHRDDLRTQRIVSRASRSFMCDQDITTPDERDRSQYYRGFAQAAGVPWFAACALWADGRPVMGVSIQRSAAEGAFEAVDLARLKRIEPHLKAAMGFSRTFADRANLERIEGLEQAGVAAFVVDHDGRLCGANSLGEAEIGRAVSVRRRRLIAIEGAAQTEFNRLIAHAGAADRAARRDLTPVRLALADGTTLLAQAIPLSDPAYRFGAGRAILTLSGGTPAGTGADLLAVAFGLTPAEARVAHHLSRGLEPEEIAALTDTSVGAVRFHLKSILPKAGVRRQAAFVALAATLLRA